MTGARVDSIESLKHFRIAMWKFAEAANVGGFDDASIEVMSLGDRRTKTLLRGGTYGRYVPGGHLLYVNRGTLFAVPFDLDTLLRTIEDMLSRRAAPD